MLKDFFKADKLGKKAVDIFIYLKFASNIAQLFIVKYISFLFQEIF